MTHLALLFPVLFLLTTIPVAVAFPNKLPRNVVIAGASSSVGYLTFQKLLKRKSFTPIGIVKDKNGYNELRKLGVADEQIRICDITKKSDVSGVFDGAEQVIICTSAVPKKKLSFKVANFFRALVGAGKAPSTSDFYYDKGQRPYEVDYLGQKHIIDECLKAKVEHVVVLGNMGGTYDCLLLIVCGYVHFDTIHAVYCGDGVIVMHTGYRGSKLNDIGRAKNDPDKKNGNALKWKRAAERYLMKRCYFTIIHAAHFTDEKGGQREIIWDTDDALLRTNFRKIPREDVAEVLVQALIHKEAIGRIIDVSSKPVATSTAAQLSPGSHAGDGAETGKEKPKMHATDWLSFWSKPGDCVYPSDFDDAEFS